MPAQVWSNISNQDFYNQIDLPQYVNQAGLAHCIDVSMAEDYIPHKQSRILEVGAGYGRVVDHLLNQSYRNVHALERSNSVGQLRRRYSENISDGTLQVHASSLEEFSTEEPFDVILWLFCGITDFSRPEQCEMLKLLSYSLAPGGKIIVDLPQGCTNAKVVHGQDHHIEAHGQPTYHSFVPTMEEMNEYRRELSFRRLSIKPYTTSTGRERALFIFSGLAHALESELALV